MKKSFYNQPNKQSKETAILNTIREYGPVSRTKIAKIFKLSAATVTKHVNRLIQTGVVKEDGSFGGDPKRAAGRRKNCDEEGVSIINGKVKMNRDIVY